MQHNIDLGKRVEKWSGLIERESSKLTTELARQRLEPMLGATREQGLKAHLPRLSGNQFTGKSSSAVEQQTVGHGWRQYSIKSVLTAYWGMLSEAISTPLRKYFRSGSGIG